MPIIWRHRFYQFWLIFTQTSVPSFQSFFKSSDLYNSGRRKNIKKWLTAMFLIFQGLSDRTIKIFMSFAVQCFVFLILFDYYNYILGLTNLKLYFLLQGLKVDDLILKFGSITLENFNGLQSIGSLVKHNQDVSLFKLWTPCNFLHCTCLISERYQY